MDLFSFAPIAALLTLASALVEGLSTLFTPFLGVASAAVAIITLTIVVRTLLIPVGISQVKAEGTRRRLAPRLQALQHRYKKNPPLLQKKTLELYREEKTSPFSGMLPTLAQVPVISVVYALFVHTTVNGHANALLTDHLFGIPLGQSFVHLIMIGATWPAAAVFGVLLGIIATVAWMTRRTALRLTVPIPDATPAAASRLRLLSWLPFITVVFAATVPLAATLYLVTTTSWTLGERMLLRRRYWSEAGSVTPPSR